MARLKKDEYTITSKGRIVIQSSITSTQRPKVTRVKGQIVKVELVPALGPAVLDRIDSASSMGAGPRLLGNGYHPQGGRKASSRSDPNL